MLTEQAARSLGYKNKFNHKITQPSFVRQGYVWKKSKYHAKFPNQFKQRKHPFSYSKYGKIFGLQAKRYIQYYDGILLYFQGQNDREEKGYCQTQNLYMYYISVGTQQLMHLTNGTQSSQFYFTNNKFYNYISGKLLKDVIQLNFYQKFEIFHLLGKGTYSKVYLAKNKATGKTIAAKIVDKKNKNGSYTKSIADEQKKILRILQSQYVCKMLQFYEQDDTYIFILEYLIGQDLMTLFKQKVQISLINLIAIFKKVLSGLQHIHQKGIMHRDLKPQNIMIDQQTMTPKLIDFGLSLIYNDKTQKKKFKRCGTIGYMAYQVISNISQKKKSYDSKCDMFSFGIIVHMMLMGFNPLKGKNYNQTVKKNQQCNIVLDKKQIINKFGNQGFQFIQKLLQRDPINRWSAGEALNSDFIRQELRYNNKICQSQLKQPQQKQNQAQYQCQDEQKPVPHRNFTPKLNLQKRINQIY